jgi:hypothetical protein
MNRATATVPPGLTCDQYYLYLSSGYTYSFLHGIMYLISQVVSEQWISTVLPPYAFRPEETAYWLSHRYYYDFGQRAWMKATFDKPLQVQERIWREASRSQPTLIRLQQKADDLMTMMATMSLKTSSSAPLVQKPAEINPKRSTFNTVRDKCCRGQQSHRIDKFFELKKVQVAPSTHKSRRSHVKEKIKTLPPTLALNPGFWKTVL